MTPVGAVCRDAVGLLLGWCGALVVQAATLSVAPGQSLQKALQRAVDDDVIEFQAGEHRGQVGVIQQKRLTLRGVGGRPVLHADGHDAEGKAILVVRGGDVRIENIEFRGARVPDGNGAGIRFEKGRLWVQGCAFIDNQNGILSSNDGAAELSVHDSEFSQAPPGSSLPHLIYVGRIARFTLSGSHVSGGNQGHLVKSRARENRVLYNRLDDRPGGQAAYELDLPNGGLAWVVGNVIGQSADTSNPTLLAFGAEGAEASDDRPHGLFLAHNTFIADGLSPAIFVRVHEQKLAAAVPRRIVNNLFIGVGLADVVVGGVSEGNHALPAVALQDSRAAEPRLGVDSWLRGRGVEPGQAHGESLQPVAEFAAPVGTRRVPPRRRWTPGAYQD